MTIFTVAATHLDCCCGYNTAAVFSRWSRDRCKSKLSGPVACACACWPPVTCGPATSAAAAWSTSSTTPQTCSIGSRHGSIGNKGCDCICQLSDSHYTALFMNNLLQVLAACVMCCSLQELHHCNAWVVYHHLEVEASGSLWSPAAAAAPAACQSLQVLHSSTVLA